MTFTSYCKNGPELHLWAISNEDRSGMIISVISKYIRYYKKSSYEHRERQRCERNSSDEELLSSFKKSILLKESFH